METQVTTTETRALTDAPPATAWGAEGIDRQDLLIPKLLLMQGLSEAVADEKAQPGDILNSVEGTVASKRGQALEIIPILTFKTWINFREEGGKFEYDSQEPMTPQNMDAPLEYEKDGQKWRRDRSLNYYVLVASELSSGMALPYLVSFRRTSYTAGKKLATHFAKCAMVKQAPAARSILLTSYLEKNDMGNYHCFDVAVGRATTPEELSTAYSWYQTLQKAQHRVDDSDLASAPTGTTPSENSVM